jgi:hypothetical protein
MTSIAIIVGTQLAAILTALTDIMFGSFVGPFVLLFPSSDFLGPLFFFLIGFCWTFWAS